MNSQQLKIQNILLLLITTFPHQLILGKATRHG